MLESKKAWDCQTVCEWLRVVKEAKKRGERSMLAKELTFVLKRVVNSKRETNPLRKSKGRSVLQGQCENADWASFVC